MPDPADPDAAGDSGTHTIAMAAEPGRAFALPNGGTPASYGSMAVSRLGQIGGTGRAAAPDQPNRITIFDTAPCATGQTVTVRGRPNGAMLSVRRGRLLAITEGGVAWREEPQAVDLRSGRTVASIALPRYVGAAALDDRTGRLFLLSRPGAPARPTGWGWVPDWARRILPLPRPAQAAESGSVIVVDTGALRSRPHQPIVPAPPLKGPTISLVIQPP